jgi:signal peptidase I
MSENKTSKLDEILDFLKTLIIAFVIVFVIKIFVLDATRVDGNSMNNTLHNNDMLFVNKIGKHFGPYKRGDIIILEAPDFPGRLYIKRIVGLPGDTIALKDGKVYLNDELMNENYTSTDVTLQTSDRDEWYMFDNEYFVMGDNRLPGESNDSRNFGPITKDRIVGHAFLRFYPFNDFGFVDKE